MRHLRLRLYGSATSRGQARTVKSKRKRLAKPILSRTIPLLIPRRRQFVDFTSGLQCRRRLADDLEEKYPIRLEQFGDAFLADLRDDDLANLGVNIRENPYALHPLRLKLVVLGWGDVVHGAGVVAVDQEQLGNRHQPLLAHRS